MLSKKFCLVLIKGMIETMPPKLWTSEIDRCLSIRFQRGGKTTKNSWQEWWKNKNQLFFQLEKNLFLSFNRSLARCWLWTPGMSKTWSTLGWTTTTTTTVMTATTTAAAASWLCLQMVGRLVRVIAGFFFFLPEVSPLTQKRIEEELKKVAWMERVNSFMWGLIL